MSSITDTRTECPYNNESHSNIVPKKILIVQTVQIVYPLQKVRIIRQVQLAIDHTKTTKPRRTKSSRFLKNGGDLLSHDATQYHRREWA